jgi:hypothetical protein
MQYILLYTDKRQCRGQRKGTKHALLAFAQTQPKWALYKLYHRGRIFHNATDPDYLVAHDDPYWQNAQRRTA